MPISAERGEKKKRKKLTDVRVIFVDTKYFKLEM